MGGEGANERWR